MVHRSARAYVFVCVCVCVYVRRGWPVASRGYIYLMGRRGRDVLL